MLLIGLTGSIGMGKSETAKMFAAEGIPVYDADAEVHKLYQKGGAAVAPIGDVFPSAIKDGAVDRALLSKEVIGKPEQLKKLESIVHPLVGGANRAFLENAAKAGAKMVLLDIPLLFETGGRERVDVIVVVSAPFELQRERVLARPDMTEEKFMDIFAKQVPDEKKRAEADFVIETDKGLDHARARVKEVIAALQGREGQVLKKLMGA